MGTATTVHRTATTRGRLDGCKQPGTQQFAVCLTDTGTRHSFYRAMHYSAYRGLEIACRLSICLSVTLVDHDHLGLV